MKASFVYLALPYSSPSSAEMERRAALADLICKQYFRDKIPVYSPITHWHGIANADPQFPRDAASFQAQNLSFLSACREMHIIALDGWQTSRGIQDEILVMRALGTPMFLFQWSTAHMRTHSKVLYL